MGGGGEVRRVKLYSRLACTQKRQKYKFVPRLLSMIVVTSDKDQCSTVDPKGKSVLHWSSETDGIGVMSEKSEGNMLFQFTVEWSPK